MKTNLTTRIISMILALAFCITHIGVVAQAKGGGPRPDEGTTTSSDMTLYWCYDVDSTDSNADLDLNQATATFNGSAWAFGESVTLDGDATIVITPIAGYRIAQIDMLCTGAGNNEDPYVCRTYNQNASYTASPAADSNTIVLSNFNASTACDHTSHSTKYYVMVTMEPVDVEASYTLTYTPGTGNGTNFTDNNGGAGYHFGDAHEILGITHPNIGFTNPGYTFTGWKVIECTDTSSIYSLLGNIYQGGETFVMPAGNVTLEAQWAPEVIPEYPVVYQYTGDVPAGAPAVPNGYQYREGATVNVHENPSLDGYIFSGWSTEDATISEGSFTMPAASVTLVGSWSKIATYQVTYIYEGDIPANAPALPIDANAYLPNANVTAAAVPSVDGYTFTGWKLDGQIVTGFVMPASDVTLVGTWAKIPTYDYSVIYNANFGANETFADAENLLNTYATSHSIQVDANMFVRENFTFQGWATAPEGAVVYQAGDVIDFTASGKVELFAIWTENAKYNYEVIYNANFGANETFADAENLLNTYAASHSIQVDANMFSRTNYTFLGWATAPEGAVVYQAGDVIDFTASGKVELFAIWAENSKFSYEVIYNANFGANESFADAENLLNTYATSHSITVDAIMFQNANFTFQGWAESPEGAVVYQAGAVINFNASGKVELYAIWAENPKFSYEVIYNANFGANETFADAENLLNTYATSHSVKIDANMFVRENFTFQGWATAPEGAVVYQAGDVIDFTASGKVELFAIWTENAKYNYEVIYNANFGANETFADAENLLNTYAASHSITVDAIMFQNANFTFQGWAESPEGAVVYQAGAVISFNASGKVELYAIWAENPKFSYEVIYNANFGENATHDDSQNLTNTFATTHSITVDANMFSRTNYTFLGWATAPEGAVVYQAGDVINFTASGKLVLFAIWKENPRYNFEVVYNANFGENAIHNDTENLFGSFVNTHSIEIDALMFERMGYTFLGWATAPEGAVVYQAGDVIDFTASGKLVLFAIWKSVARFDYEVIYHANFGFRPQTARDLENIYNTLATAHSIQIDANMFTRNGYSFLGWATSPEGKPTYQADDVIDFENGGSITLYAVWSRDARYDYELIYNANFGTDPETKIDSESKYNSYSIAHEIKVDANSFVRPGYTFLGWAETRNGAVVYRAGNVILFVQGGSVTLYAVWAKNPEPPTIPTEPTAPTTEPTIPTEPTAPTTEPTIPTEPTAPTTEPTIPTEPTAPTTEPTIPTEPTAPTTEPTIPTEPSTEPTIPTEPTTEPSEPTVPTTGDEEIDIHDDDVPLDDVPGTGDPMILLTGLAALSGTGLSVMLNLKKKDEEEETEA